MKAKELEINLHNLLGLNFKGKGGKESNLEKLFSSSWKRESCKLHDFRNIKTGTLIELKKQGNQQWFDPSKHYLLSEEEKNILIMFCLWQRETGIIDALFTVRTEDFVQQNFTPQELKDSYEYNQKYPKIQLKEGIYMRKWFHKNRDKINLLYIRDADIGNI